MKQKSVIKHLEKCFSYAVAKNKGNSKAIAEALRNIPLHVFGQHEKCGDWCGIDTKSHTILLNNKDLFNALLQICIVYAENAHKFSIAASSQRNECLNQTITKKYSKDKCYSTSESGDYRVASGVLQFNEMHNGIQQTKKKLGLSPGIFTSTLVETRDNVRKIRSEKIKTKAAKARRILIAKKRDILKIVTERNEGVTYQSNCGIRLNTDVPESNNMISHESSKSKNNITIVFYDLETSGLNINCDILQIAAKSGENQFSVCITPKQDINRSQCFQSYRFNGCWLQTLL